MYDYINKINIAKTNYRKTQYEPNIIKTVHVDEMPPVFSELLDSATNTLISADILSGMTSSVLKHNGNSESYIKKMKINNTTYQTILKIL